ncbi:MAG: F0F1 ATP synthase subunit B [Oscillospiraceae bacterium]|nr:F0F1 ATP synthase subunit B [Oscillospiraceae bacterium]
MVILTQAASEGFVDLNVWTAIFTLVNLLLLFFVMKKYLFKPVKKMIDERQQEIDDLYADANQSKTEAAELKSQYETRLAEANEEKEEILRAAHRKAQLREEEILREAQDKAAQTLKRADQQIEMEKKRALNEIKDDVSGMALDIASAVLARDIKGEEHTALIDSFIENLGESHD